MNHHVSRALRPLLAALALSACSIAAVDAAAADAAAAAGPAVPQNAVEWRQAAVGDVEEAVRLTRENHPGTYDRANPAFPARLDAARKDALALAARVDGPAAYMAALMRFNAALGDGHAGIVPQLGAAARPAVRWPGFVTAWRQEGLFVQASDSAVPATGARVLDCDGTPIAQLVDSNVFAFDGRADEPGRWWSRARTLFLDTGNPFVALPRRCRFSVDGQTVERALAWKPLDAQAERWLKDGYNGPVLEVGLSEPRPGLFWAAMPTFEPDEAQRAAYRAMTAQVTDQRRRFLDADAVVIDLRRNQGGSSAWSRLFAGALWGEDRLARRMAARSAKTETWWRASQGNADYMAGVLDEFTRENRTESLAWARTNSAGLHAALARGDKFYVEKGDAPTGAAGDPAADLPSDPPPFTRPVYVIVPGQCASACLDALDAFTQFPNTILVGAPSSADSTYMEVRLQKLTSGLASVVIPNKVYVNRARASGQVYLPAIYVNDPDWSVATFRRVIEEDLGRRR